MNSEAREWRHQSDKTQTNKLEWWMILKISLRKKAGVPKTLVKRNFAYIPYISLRTRLCWLSLAGNSVICILFLDFVHFPILEFITFYQNALHLMRSWFNQSTLHHFLPEYIASLTARACHTEPSSFFSCIPARKISGYIFSHLPVKRCESCLTIITLAFVKVCESL